jgi:hypothetical protein
MEAKEQSAKTNDFSDMAYVHRVAHELTTQAHSQTQPSSIAGQTAFFCQQFPKASQHCLSCPNDPSPTVPCHAGPHAHSSLLRHDARQRTLSPQALSRSRL